MELTGESGPFQELCPEQSKRGQVTALGKGSDWASILAPGPVTTEHLWDQEGPVEVALTTGMSGHAMQR